MYKIPKNTQNNRYKKTLRGERSDPTRVKIIPATIHPLYIFEKRRKSDDDDDDFYDDDRNRCDTMRSDDGGENDDDDDDEEEQQQNDDETPIIKNGGGVEMQNMGGGIYIPCIMVKFGWRWLEHTFFFIGQDIQYVFGNPLHHKYIFACTFARKYFVSRKMHFAPKSQKNRFFQVILKNYRGYRVSKSCSDRNFLDLNT